VVAAQQNKCLAQVHLVLDAVHAPDCAEHDAVRRGKAGWKQIASSRVKAPVINAIVDAADFFTADPSTALQVVFEFFGKCNEAMDQWAVQTAQPLVLAVAAIRIVHVPAVLPVYAAGYTGQPGRDLRLETADVPRVHDARPNPAKQPVQAPPAPQVLPRALMHLVNLDIAAHDALPEVGRLGEAYDRVPISISRHLVHQVDDAVLQATDLQPIDHVGNEGAGVVAISSRRQGAHPGR
jgi:hypothetical protein